MTRARDTASLPTGVSVDSSNNVNVPARLGVGPALSSGSQMQIVNQTASDIALTVIGHASQSTNILSIRSNSSSNYLHVGATGNVFVGSPISAGQNTGGLTINGKDIELMQIMGAY